jgi:hypothetical protein
LAVGYHEGRSLRNLCGSKADPIRSTETHVLRREGESVGRDRIARFMSTLGLVGAVRERSIRTTKPADLAARPADQVERTFAAPAPNRLWVADLTFVWMIAGFAYTAAQFLPREPPRFPGRFSGRPHALSARIVARDKVLSSLRHNTQPCRPP